MHSLERTIEKVASKKTKEAYLYKKQELLANSTFSKIVRLAAISTRPPQSNTPRALKAQ